MCGYKTGEGKLESVAYYENPGILMIVQSVEDDTFTWARGNH